MPSLEQRIANIEKYIANSRQLVELPSISSPIGDERVAMYSPNAKQLVQYPLASIIAGGTIDPTNDMKARFVNIPDPNFNFTSEQQVASYVNSSDDFDKTANEQVFYVLTRKRVDSSEDSGWKFYREVYLLNVDKGTYGKTGDSVVSTDSVFYTRVESNEYNTQLIQLGATLPYNIQDVVNASTSFTPSPSGNILFEIQIGGSPSEYWLYQGQTIQDMGSGGYVSVSDDYIELATATQDPMYQIPSSALSTLEIGFMDYNDASAAVSLTADTWTDVPNDGAGAFTNKTYKPSTVTEIIDTSTGYLDFSDLSLGSQIMVRNDFTIVPNTNNALLEARYVLGQGANEYNLKFWSERLDSGSGIDYQRVISFPIYMGDTNTQGGVGKLQVKLSTNGTLNNAGSYIDIQIR